VGRGSSFARYPRREIEIIQVMEDRDILLGEYSRINIKICPRLAKLTPYLPRFKDNSRISSKRIEKMSRCKSYKSEWKIQLRYWLLELVGRFSYCTADVELEASLVSATNPSQSISI
jgi:hypothetical protein